MSLEISKERELAAVGALNQGEVVRDNLAMFGRYTAELETERDSQDA